MAGRGPLPKPDGERSRRQKPTIPTTQLPAGGRADSPPPCPYVLEDEGVRWWDWAWATPQAAGWSDGDAYFVARRARMEDDDERTPATVREMREMDDRLGLTPKGLAALRWKIVEEETQTAAAPVEVLRLIEKSA